MMSGLIARTASIAEAELLDRLRPQRMHEDVGGRDQLVQRGHVVGALEVEHHAALVAVEMQEAAGHAWIAVRPVAAKRVAFGAFDLDHVRAHVRHDVGRERTHDDIGQIDDPDAARVGRPPGVVSTASTFLPLRLNFIAHRPRSCRSRTRVRCTSMRRANGINMLLSTAAFITYAIVKSQSPLAARRPIKDFQQNKSTEERDDDLDEVRARDACSAVHGSSWQ